MNLLQRLLRRSSHGLRHPDVHAAKVRLPILLPLPYLIARRREEPIAGRGALLRAGLVAATVAVGFVVVAHHLAVAQEALAQSVAVHES